MSLTDKITMLMARPGSDNVQKDDIPWWMRYAGRGLGTAGGFLAMFLSLFNILSLVFLNVSCLLAGIWQMVAGFILIVCEAPCCCFFVDHVQVISDKIDMRPYWNKAAIYIGLAIPAFFFCPFSVSTFLGSGLIFATGIVYGMMALGKKASMEDMRSSAANIEAGLSQPTTATKANLVTNEQPVSFTGIPVTH